MSITATEAALKRDEEAIANNRINRMIRDFIKAYEPEERRDRLDFEMHFHEIIREIYREAAKPYEKALLGAACISTPAKIIVSSTV